MSSTGSEYTFFDGKYRIKCMGYYPPEGKVVWEATDTKTGEGVAHGYSLRQCLVQLVEAEHIEKRREIREFFYGKVKPWIEKHEDADKSGKAILKEIERLFQT